MHARVFVYACVCLCACTCVCVRNGKRKRAKGKNRISGVVRPCRGVQMFMTCAADDPNFAPLKTARLMTGVIQIRATEMVVIQGLWLHYQ